MTSVQPPGPVGVLVVNLGTPDAPDPASVRRYLREFLSDPRVIDIPAPARWLLLNLVILPFRPRVASEAYRKIWTERGSPLRTEGEDLVAGMARDLGEGFVVELGMRYGSPSIPSALRRLQERGAARLVVLPLYPQAASSSSGSSLQAVFEAASLQWNVPAIAVVPPFWADDATLDAWVENLAPRLRDEAPDHVLFSFHGLPERHVLKGDAFGHGCLQRESCCDAVVSSNRDCYRAQCFATARLLAGRLGLEPGSWSLSFQSRLGRTPWLKPWTDEVLKTLAASGKRRVAVCCPGFVADCLETIEEIGMRGAASFVEHGGERLTLMPSLNAHPAWIRAASALVRRTAGA